MMDKTYVVKTKDNEVSSVEEVKVIETETSEIRKEYTLADIDERLARINAEKTKYEALRASVSAEAKKVKLMAVKKK